MAKLIPVPQVAVKQTIIPINAEVKKRLNKWRRVEILLEQDEDAIASEFCRQLPNEDATRFTDRKKTYLDTFVNITQDLITAPINSVFSQGVKIGYDSSTSIFEKFNASVTGGVRNVSMIKYMNEVVALMLRAFGSVCTIIDKPNFVPVNLQEEIDYGMPYLNSIRLSDIINWELDENGDFEWFCYRKNYAPPWENPFVEQPPVALELECLYTKTEYIVRQRNGKVIPELSYAHNFGVVPVVVQSSFLLYQNDIIGNAAMFQSSNSIISMNNMFNVGAYELYKHGGSLLLMNEDAMVSGKNLETDEEGNVNTKKHDSGGLLVWGGEIPPAYLIKDIKAEDFLKWGEFYKNAAIDNERDMKSVLARKGTTGEMVQESGFAKMVDREPLEANLISLSEDIEFWYAQVAEKIGKILNKPNDSVVEFDKDYDLRSIKQKYEELKQAIDNKCEKVSVTLFKEHWKNIVPDVVRDTDLVNTINAEIDEYDPDAFEKEIEEKMNKINKSASPLPPGFNTGEPEGDEDLT